MVEKKVWYHGFVDGKAKFSYTCASCGHSVSESDKICTGCGEKFNEKQLDEHNANVL